jgi:seryl-tRNA synthetase
MLDPKRLRTEPETVAELLKKKGHDFDVAAFSALEDKRKALQVDTESLQNERNTKSKNIGKAKAEGADIAPLLAEVDDLKATLQKK